MRSFIYFSLPVLLAFASLSMVAPSLAQLPPPQNRTAELRNAYQFGISGTTFLPSRIAGVYEIVPGWRLSATTPTTRGVFETSAMLGRGRGIDYKSFAFGYRLDIPVDALQAFFLFGLHADVFESEYRSRAFSGGWHYGGGMNLLISGPLYLRADFRHRFSPGQAVEIGVGLIYRLSAGGGEGN